MPVVKMKNPCIGCPRTDDRENCTSYRTCADYRFWINWNWAVFRGYLRRHTTPNQSNPCGKKAAP